MYSQKFSSDHNLFSPKTYGQSRSLTSSPDDDEEIDQLSKTLNTCSPLLSITEQNKELSLSTCGPLKEKLQHSVTCSNAHASQSRTLHIYLPPPSSIVTGLYCLNSYALGFDRNPLLALTTAKRKPLQRFTEGCYSTSLKPATQQLFPQLTQNQTGQLQLATLKARKNIPQQVLLRIH